MNNNLVDVAAITQVIGCVFNNSDLLQDTDKYVIREDDFVDDFHKITYGAIYNIFLSGSKVTLDAVIDYLANRPKFNATFQQYKGVDYLLEASQIAKEDTFNYYYNRLKKFTLLRAYEKYGVDISEFYDGNNVLDTKKKQEQEEWLDNHTIANIVTLVDQRIEEIKSKYAEADLGLSFQAGEGIDKLIDSLKQRPAVGIPMYGPLINTVTRGARLGKFYIRSAASGVGKSICNSTIIPTPEGYKRVDEIKVGDYLFDGFGKPTKVLGVFPQGQQEVWEVRFKDGRVAHCSKDHLWSFCTEGQRKQFKEGRKFYTETLEEISKRPLTRPGHGNQILVPMQQAVSYPEKSFSIDPYILGLALGDGSFRYQDSNKAFMFSSADEELVRYIANINNWEYKQYENHSKYSWYFEYKDNNKLHKNVWVQELLKDYPELWNTKSEDKFIPKDFLLGSIEQRLALLNGLLDSDGSIDKEKGRVRYCTVSSRLRDNVIELCRSLGFKANWTEDTHKDTLPLYNIEIVGRPKDKIKLFNLKRKKDLIIQWYNNGKRKESNLFNPIIEIINTKTKEEMTCFLVDNREHLFLMNDFIVTHNTRTLIADACNFACTELYHEDFGWIKNGQSYPTLFIATEQDLQEVQTLMLAFISNVNEAHILDGKYEDGEEERVRKAAQIIKNSNLYIELLPDFSLQDVENKIKKYIREFDVRYIVLDYLQTSLKILEEITRRSGGIRLREDNVLFMFSARLKDLANKYGVFILSATQLNGKKR